MKQNLIFFQLSLRLDNAILEHKWIYVLFFRIRDDFDLVLNQVNLIPDLKKKNGQMKQKKKRNAWSESVWEEYEREPNSQKNG